MTGHRMGHCQRCQSLLLLLGGFLILSLVAPVSGAASPGCKRTLSCDFDHPPDMCGFTDHHGLNKNQWFRSNSHYQMPPGNDYYMYTIKGSQDNSGTVDLTSPPLCDAASVNVTFRYVVTRSTGQLNVTTQCQGQGRDIDQYSLRYEYISRKRWRQSHLTLRACSDSDTVVIFRGIMPDYPRTKVVALNDIVIELPPPLTTPVPTEPTSRKMTTAAPVSKITSSRCDRTLSCDLDNSHSMCDFNGYNGLERNQWLKDNNHYEMPPGNEYYMYTSKGSKDNSNTVDLTSPPLCDAASVTVTFSYVVTRAMGQLNVTTQCQGQGRDIDQRSLQYDYGSRKTWRQSDLTLRACSNSDTVVIFRGIIPSFPQEKVVALKDIVIQLSPSTTRTTKLPAASSTSEQPPLPTTTKTTMKSTSVAATTPQPSTATSATTEERTTSKETATPTPTTTTPTPTTPTTTTPTPTTTTPTTPTPTPTPTTPTPTRTTPTTPTPTPTPRTTTPTTPTPTPTTTTLTTPTPTTTTLTTPTPTKTTPTTPNPTVPTPKPATSKPTKSTPELTKPTPKPIMPTPKLPTPKPTTPKPPTPKPTTATPRSTTHKLTTTTKLTTPEPTSSPNTATTSQTGGQASRAGKSGSSQTTYIIVGAVLGSVLLIVLIVVVVVIKFFGRRTSATVGCEMVMDETSVEHIMRKGKKDSASEL